MPSSKSVLEGSLNAFEVPAVSAAADKEVIEDSQNHVTSRNSSSDG
jgi:hypothetical protein